METMNEFDATNPTVDMIGGYAIPLSPEDFLQCDSCQ